MTDFKALVGKTIISTHSYRKQGALFTEEWLILDDGSALGIGGLPVNRLVPQAEVSNELVTLAADAEERLNALRRGLRVTQDGDKGEPENTGITS